MIGSRGAMLTGIAAMLFTTAAVGATARKGPVRKRAAAPAAKPISPTQALSTQLVLNRTLPGEEAGAVCRRASFKNLAVALNMNRSMLDREKGEFETDAEFADLSGKIEGLMAGEPIIFCESLDDNPDISFKYKADDQVFEGSFSKNHNVWRDVKQLGSYRTKTRMGVPVTVKSSAEFEYEIALDMQQDMVGCLSGSYSYDFRVPHPISTAPSLKALGRIVFQVRLAAPYVTLQESPGEATLDDPYDIYTYAITLHGKPEKIYVVDAAGKEVWSCRVGALNPLQEAKPVGSTKTWVWISDYPTSGYRQRAEGTVKATLNVGADGTVKNCGVTSSSGFPELDSATCSAWTKRGKFVPASDKDGNPISSQFAISRSWTSYGGSTD